MASNHNIGTIKQIKNFGKILWINLFPAFYMKKRNKLIICSYKKYIFCLHSNFQILRLKILAMVNNMSNDDLIKLMSKLLLKGAKMLGKSCEKCGTPLFEYKGQVFCPKCDIYDKQGKIESLPPEKKEKKEKGSTTVKNTFETRINLTDLYQDIERNILISIKKIIQEVSSEKELQSVKEKLLISDMLINLLLKLKKTGDF